MIIERTVPQHDVDLLADCELQDLVRIEETIAGAISVGAPLYNLGDHEGCFKKYQATAIELDQKLERCTQVRAALLAGVRRAEGLEDYTAKAWAMRDAFDGVLEVIAKKLLAEGLVKRFIPERQVPEHDPALLRGCSSDTLGKLESAIGDAIEVGAPLYNDGNAEACFRIYQGTALNLLRGILPQGPRSALESGLARADAARGWEAKAWAMRDTFDGLLMVIAKKLDAELN